MSLWVRDVEFIPWPQRRTGHWTRPNPHPLQIAKEREIERCRQEGVERIGQLSEREFLVLGLALYAGEGTKSKTLNFANSDPRLILTFITWLRHFFDVDESKFRVRLYLHEHLDLEAAQAFWSELTGIPLVQFYKAYRAVVDPTIRRTKHEMGCPGITYLSTSRFRRVMGLVEAVSSSAAIPG